MKKCEKCGIEYEGNSCPSGCNSPAFANAQQPGAQQPVQYQASGQPAPQNPYQQPVYQQPTQPVYQQPIQQGQYYPQQQMPTIIINNANTNTNTNMNTNAHPMYGRPKNKWVAIILCVLLGMVGGHKFYEGKIGMGILYLFTGGLFFIGVIIDFIALLTKPNPYFV